MVDDWSRRQTIMAAFRACFRLPGWVLAGSMVGFGGLAHDVGWTVWDVVLATVFIWALPAQIILINMQAAGAGILTLLMAVSLSSVRLMPMVCSILPQLRGAKTRLLTLVAASHFVAQTVWILSLLNLPDVPRSARLLFYFVLSFVSVLFSLAACLAGFGLSGFLPKPLAVGLLILTPASFLFSTEKTAGLFRPAFWLGLFLLWPVHEGLARWQAESFDLIATGLLAGGIAFLVRLKARPAVLSETV